MANLEPHELERYEIAKERIKECDAGIENSMARINDHERFIEKYEKIHKVESEFILLAEKKLALP